MVTLRLHGLTEPTVVLACAFCLKAHCIFVSVFFFFFLGGAYIAIYIFREKLSILPVYIFFYIEVIVHFLHRSNKRFKKKIKLWSLRHDFHFDRTAKTLVEPNKQY